MGIIMLIFNKISQTNPVVETLLEPNLQSLQSVEERPLLWLVSIYSGIHSNTIVFCNTIRSCMCHHNWSRTVFIVTHDSEIMQTGWVRVFTFEISLVI